MFNTHPFDHYSGSAATEFSLFLSDRALPPLAGYKMSPGWLHSPRVSFNAAGGIGLSDEKWRRGEQVFFYERWFHSRSEYGHLQRLGPCFLPRLLVILTVSIWIWKAWRHEVEGVPARGRWEQTDSAGVTVRQRASLLWLSQILSLSDHKS